MRSYGGGIFVDISLQFGRTCAPLRPQRVHHPRAERWHRHVFRVVIHVDYGLGGKAARAIFPKLQELGHELS